MDNKEVALELAKIVIEKTNQQGTKETLTSQIVKIYKDVLQQLEANE